MSLSNEEIAVLKSLLDKLSPPPTEGVAASPQVITPSSSPVTVPVVEKVSGKKFLDGMLSILNPVSWAKDICSLFNIRKIIIYAVIVGAFWGWGYLGGIAHKPVHVDLNGKEAVVELGENLYLHILPDGTLHTQDKNGKTIHIINVKDIPALQEKLTPIGFQLKPIGVLGIGTGAGSANFEGGVGISWYKLWMANLESFVTNKGFYPLGVSYRLNQLNMPNSSVGVAGGLGYDKSQRVMFYYRWQF